MYVHCNGRHNITQKMWADLITGSVNGDSHVTSRVNVELIKYHQLVEYQNLLWPVPVPRDQFLLPVPSVPVSFGTGITMSYIYYF